MKTIEKKLLPDGRTVYQIDVGDMPADRVQAVIQSAMAKYRDTH